MAAPARAAGRGRAAAPCLRVPCGRAGLGSARLRRWRGPVAAGGVAACADVAADVALSPRPREVTACRGGFRGHLQWAELLPVPFPEPRSTCGAWSAR